jgi:hypothetical protein
MLVRYHSRSPQYRERVWLVPNTVLYISIFVSASRNCRPENVRVLTIVVSELEFRNVQQHVFGAHLVKCAHHTAFEDRPEAFDGLSVNRAEYSHDANQDCPALDLLPASQSDPTENPHASPMVRCFRPAV